MRQGKLLAASARYLARYERGKTMSMIKIETSHNDLLRRYADLIIPLLDEERLEELAREALLSNCENLTEKELLREIEELEHQ